MKFILGYKLPMTQTFTKEGRVLPVTQIQAGPCFVTQVKNKETDGYTAVQVGFGKAKKFTKAQKGHIKKAGKQEHKFRHFAEFRIRKDKDDVKFEPGQSVLAAIFEPGDNVKVTGTVKGRGFQGVVKRHGFHGGKKSHGHKDQLRMPGSIGAGGIQKVFKGKRMGGRMGGNQQTVKNLEIVGVNKEKNVLFVKGAVPGAVNGLVKIVTE